MSVHALIERILSARAVLVDLHEDGAASCDDTLGCTLKENGHVVLSTAGVKLFLIHVTHHAVELNRRVERNLN